MARAQRSIEVDVPPEQLFAVIVDYARYPEFLSDARRVTVGKRSGNAVDVTWEISLVGTTIRYTLRMVESPPNRVTWSLVEGQFMKSDDGFWQLDSLVAGRTRATYAIDVGVGMLVPKAVVNALVETSLPKMLEQFKARAESLRAAG